MTLHGKIQNGVVVLDGGTSLPDGTEVAVLVPITSATDDAASAAERERRRKALAEILAIPDENPGDTFSGADHDQVLYGEHR
jgi:hypothetical protein